MERRRQAGSKDIGELLQKTSAVLALPSIASIWEDIVSHLGRALHVDWAFLVELPPGEKTNPHTLAAWHRGKIVPNFEYSFERIPEDDALSRDICIYSTGAQKHLRNPWLKQVRAQAFGRASLFDSLGRLRGILVIAHSQLLQDPDSVEAVLRISAFRAATELERTLADEHLYRELLEHARAPRPRESRSR